MNRIDVLQHSFLPLDRRTPPQTYFIRIIGRDPQGKILNFLAQYEKLAQSFGARFQDGIPKPSEQETSRFFDCVGTRFALSKPLIERHMTIWLGQLRPAQRAKLSAGLWEGLEFLRKQGVNETVLRNTYIKFMCWLRSQLGRVLTGLSKGEPPKLLFLGTISRYEALMLHILHQAGCDVWYVNFTSDASYRKADPSGQFSQLVQGEVLEAPGSPPPPATKTAPRTSAPPPVNVPLPPAPWAGLEQEVIVNRWFGEQPVWEAVLLDGSQRGDTPRLRSILCAFFGADERSGYRNRLFHLKQDLDRSRRTWILLDQKIPAPNASETSRFLKVNRNTSRAALIRGLAQQITPNCGRVQVLLAQFAFTQVMEQDPEPDWVKLFNHGVRLACWLQDFVQRLFANPSGKQPPVVLCYGALKDAGLSLLWALAQVGVDVLYFSPELDTKQVFERHFLAKLWLEICFESSLPLEPFPQREELVRAGTTAYRASRELDQLLYSDTGMFRDRQFARSQPVTLRTTYDEVGQLWPEEAQYRPSFRTSAGVVYVPNLFVKISGVDQGDLELYWNTIRSMITENTYLVTEVPFLKSERESPSMSAAQAKAFIHQGKLDPRALKASQYYRYGYLPDDTQDYILEKIQALMDYDLIIGGGSNTGAVMLSVLMNLDKELLRLLQQFDFTRSIPKFLIVDVTERLFSLEECILLAFLNLTGFDIAIFTPTGYRNLETHLRPDSFDLITAGGFYFDLSVPELRRSNKSGWLGRLFGGS